MRRARQGDTAAFSELVTRHERRVYLVALGVMRSSEDAADVAQESFIAAYRHLGSFEGGAAFTTWLHRIVLRKAYDARRKRVPEPVDPAGSYMASMADPVNDVEQGATRSDLLAALERIDVAFRDAVLLVDVAGMSVADAAAALDVAPGTVKSRVFRGRAALARELGTLGYGDASDG